LPADGRPFENDGSQSFGGPVHGSAQPSRSRSINRKGSIANFGAGILIG
jgi:hypothetical protein